MDPALQLEMGYRRTSYGYMFCRRRPGRGGALVMLHGLGASSNTWRKLIRFLPNDSDIYMPDLIGHGHSDAPDIEYEMAVQLKSVSEFIGSLRIENPVVLGHSYGAWIAGLYAARNSSGGIIFEDSAGLEPFVEHLRDTAKEGAYRSWLLEESLKICPERPHVMSSIINNMDRDTLTGGTLSKIKCKTLIVWGGSDSIVPSSLGNWLAEEIGGSRLVIIDGADHVPHISKPDAVGSVVSEFLASIR